ncbi:MAG: glycerophosphodiester phosphodiesterase [Terriglobales bacterium]
MLLLGHRGARASRHVPENTLESFELCMQHGCDGFEFDVRRSADEAAVICHDPVIAGMEVSSTAANLLALPSLEDVLCQFSARAFLDIELKVPGLETQLVAALGANPPRKGYVVSSFLPEVLRAVHQLDAGVPLGFLYDRRDHDRLDHDRPDNDRPEQALPPDPPLAYLIPHFALVTRELVEATHASGSQVMTWTVNRAEEITRFAQWGVDAIISDNTELLVRTLR